MRLVLVGCVKSKRAGSHPAEELYDSRLFRGRLAYARANADRWFILSALYGLLPPDRVVDSYERAITSLSRGERRMWSEGVLRELDSTLGSLSLVDVEIHAGAEYSRWGLADGLRQRGARVTLPLEHKSFGEQLQCYARAGY